MKRLFAFSILASQLIIWLITVPSIAYSTEIVDQPKTTAIGLLKQKPEEEKTWGFTGSYWVNTDFNQQVEPRSYFHRIDLGVSKELSKSYTLSAASGVDYQTLDSTVARTDKSENYFDYRDINLALEKKLDLANLDHRVAIELNYDLLVSDESRYFGYRSVFGLDGSWKWLLGSKWSVNSSASGSYIVNRYRFSPVGGATIQKGQILPDSFFQAATGPSLKIWKELSLGFQVSTRATHYLDGSQILSLGNSYLARYNFKSWWVSAKYINRGYADRGETNLWFADEYKKLAQFGLGITY